MNEFSFCGNRLEEIGIKSNELNEFLNQIYNFWINFGGLYNFEHFFDQFITVCLYLQIYDKPSRKC